MYIPLFPTSKGCGAGGFWKGTGADFQLCEFQFHRVSLESHEKVQILVCYEITTLYNLNAALCTKRDSPRLFPVKLVWNTSKRNGVPRLYIQFHNFRVTGLQVCQTMSQWGVMGLPPTCPKIHTRGQTKVSKASDWTSEFSIKTRHCFCRNFQILKTVLSVF